MTPPTELTLVTNSPAIAYELVDERILVIVTPGELDQHMRLLAGRWTTDFLAGLNFGLAFCSSAGITLDAGVEIWAKRLELLKEAIPSTARAAFLSMRDGWEGSFGQVLQDAGGRLGIVNRPSLSVTAERCALVPVFVTVTVAPGRAPRVESVT